MANHISLGVEPPCCFSTWNFSWCICYLVDFCGQCMKFNPLALAEQHGDSEFVLTRIETTCARNPFISTFWTWFLLAVRLQSFLSTRERAILSRTNSVICLDSTEVLLLSQNSKKIYRSIAGKYPLLEWQRGRALRTDCNFSWFFRWVFAEKFA